MTQLTKLNAGRRVASRSVNKDLINISESGKSLPVAILNGAGITIEYTGADIGTGEVTVYVDPTSNSKGINDITGTGILIKNSGNAFATRELKSQTGLVITNSKGSGGDFFIDLPSVVTSGRYKYVDVNQYGQVTGGANSNVGYIANEILSTSDNIHYSIQYTPVFGSVSVFVAGQKQIPGAAYDYTISGKDITFNSANDPSAVVAVSYYDNGSIAETSDYIANEILTPTNFIDYQLQYMPVLNTVQVYLNGQLITPGVGNDYTIIGRNITILHNFIDASDVLTATYFK